MRGRRKGKRRKLKKFIECYVKVIHNETKKFMDLPKLFSAYTNRTFSLINSQREREAKVFNYKINRRKCIMNGIREVIM